MNFHEMFDPPDHPVDLGRTLKLALAPDLAKAQTFYGLAHTGGGADRTPYKFNANGVAHGSVPG
jgi:hypothetical protein